MSLREVLTRTAPLGLRPWDAVTGRAVTDGLSLRELRSGCAATPNRSGVFVFHDLPGLRSSADGRGDDGFWASPPASARLQFELVDSERRYLPMRFGADAPARIRRALPVGALPPGKVDVATVALFSAPSRPVPPGLAAVRADLWDVERDAPAAWAVLEVTAGGSSTSAIADDEGRVLVVLAYPEPRWPGSSPPPGSLALADQTWSLHLALRYRPAAGAAGAMPALDTVLEQPYGGLLEDHPPATPLAGPTLAFGRALTLRSRGRSVLLVSPGTGEPDA